MEKENKREDTPGYESIVENFEMFKGLKNELISSLKICANGIVNLVCNYEDPAIIDAFLLNLFGCDGEYKDTCIYNDNPNVDSIDLQNGAPGMGFAFTYIESLIYGDVKENPTPTSQSDMFIIDKETGLRERKSNGFVHARCLPLKPKDEALKSFKKNNILIIRNLDYCNDFCGSLAGDVDSKCINIFDKFRHASVNRGKRILLISNKPIKLPFSIRTVEVPIVDNNGSEYIVDYCVKAIKNGGANINITDSQKKQFARKIIGLYYSNSVETILRAMMDSYDKEKNSINVNVAIRKLRKIINSGFIDGNSIITQLTSKPWGDYICPESSNFTYDIKKILRDFSEIGTIKSQPYSEINQHNMESIRTRMPHIIVLYGKGGTGKSAFPIHFAGLLEFDVWDFNINACHSKWVGEGAERMRKSLKTIENSSHIVVRIDEYDRAIGAYDNSGSGMHSAHKQVESEFMNWLQNMQEDSLFVKKDIFIVMTTNHKDNITGPLLRSGRADLVIDIANFDKKSIITTLMTAPTRMSNRGVKVCGFINEEDFISNISKLDVDKIAKLIAERSFTVRDVDVLLQEMASHKYFYNKYGTGIDWTTENFVKVIENSTGSTASENTCELVLGDRAILDVKKDDQMVFDFYKNDYTNSILDLEPDCFVERKI